MPSISRTLAAVAITVVPVFAVAQPRTVTLLDYRATVPTGWTPRQPSSSMRLAEYLVPVPGMGHADAIVYFFGPGQGGSAVANLERWKAQFSTPDGSPVYERITKDSTRVASLVVAEYRGTYARGVGMGSTSSAALPNHTLVAVVATTPRGTLFYQLYGPSPTVAAARAAYLGFVRSLTSVPPG
ncbi:MAG: hypothetical protein MUE41_08025 [Gemmatimonadaceae bacterium]|nr:hypothetical protein [Gemmatimonadaceae bacterium]